MEREKMGENIATEVIRDVMAEEGLTHLALSQLMGYKSSAGVSERLSTRKLSVDRMVAMLGAMGYEVIVRKAGEEEGGKEWRVVG